MPGSGISPREQTEHSPDLEQGVWTDISDASTQASNISFGEDLRNIVNNRKKYIQSHNDLVNQQSIVDDVSKVCEDEEMLSAMCTYDGVHSYFGGELTKEMEEVIANQPWGKKGKKAWEKYNRFISDLQPHVKVKLQESLILAHKEHLANVDLDRLFPRARKQDFVRDLRYPQRRPSARVIRPPRDGEGSPQDGMPNKEPYTSPKQTSPRRAQTPPPSRSPKNDSDESRTHSSQKGQKTQDPQGKRPGSVGSTQLNRFGPSTQPEVQPITENRSGYQGRQNGQPCATKFNLLPNKKLSNFEMIAYDVVRIFLGGSRPLTYYGGLKAQVDHMIGVFKVMTLLNQH